MPGATSRAATWSRKTRRTACLFSTNRLVAAVGLDAHVVIETKDAVMVAPKSRVQDVKRLVDRMKKAGRSEPGLHREVFRPWGSYDSVDAGPRFQVKRLTVKPGADALAAETPASR